MELASYSDYALRLVNSEEPARGTDTLTSVDAVRALFGASTQAARRATEADVTRFRSVRGYSARSSRRRPKGTSSRRSTCSTPCSWSSR
ncbi:hypothetical protein ACFQVA_29280 [Actinomadura keratinilytica]